MREDPCIYTQHSFHGSFYRALSRRISLSAAYNYHRPTRITLATTRQYNNKSKLPIPTYLRRPLRFSLSAGILYFHSGIHLGWRPISVRAIIVLRLLGCWRGRVVALRQSWRPVERRRMRHRTSVVEVHVTARVLRGVLIWMRGTMRRGREAVNRVASRAGTA